MYDGVEASEIGVSTLFGKLNIFLWLLEKEEGNK